MLQLVRRRNGERGQALVMATLSLFVICGILGLAVDLGWSYFRTKTARTAADAAALAAAKAAFPGAGSLQAVSLTSCSSVSDANLQVGCEYAQQNDFDYTKNANQIVKMQAGTGTYTTQTGGTFPTQYWAKAVAAESIPQLFSAILGHTTGQASAFATAGIVKVIVNGALILLNQAKANDCAIFSTGNGNGNTTNKTYCGVDLNVQGSGGTSSTGNGNGTTYTLQTSGNILLSSTCNNGGTGCSAGAYAGMNQGGSIYTSGAGTQIKGSGGYWQNNNGTWQSTPTNGAVDGFGDPLANLNQPPVPSTTTQSNVIKVPTSNGVGVLSTSVCNPCGSGSYVAVDSKGVPNGYPIQVSGNVTFNGGSFGQFVIYGGLTGGNNSAATFGPGEYIFAGAQAPKNGTPGSVLATGTGFSLQDSTTATNGAGFTGPASNAGELLVFTDVAHNNLGLTPSVTGMSASVQSSLAYGNVNLQSGNTTNNTIDLHGLNLSNLPASGAGSSFGNYTPILAWQDRGNVYDPNSPSNAPELAISASPNVHLYGTIYQPEGSWTTLNGGGGYSGPLQIISGALNMQGSAKIDLTTPTTPLTTLKVALIE